MLLKVNQEKSHVAYVSSPQTKFLGYGFYYSRTKRELRLTIHKKSKQKLKDTIRKLLSRSPKRNRITKTKKKQISREVALTEKLQN